ncbi:hypothetical protein G6F55_014682 [Rhizopus delemar]|nr:hypothetical protein G6F23_015961 [Rhizopus arrhizus]KAG1433539.1 hypothetical protein G6F55_014682 [Rhizopus delemar]
MKLAANVRSSAAICEHTADPSITITICDDSAGQMRLSAGFSTTCRKTWKRVIARLAPASYWPLGVASMPARMISAL